MSFWLSLAALTALALALLWLPLRRAQADSAAATDDQLRRLREFDSELAAGDIDASIAPALRAELERAVIDGLPASAAAPVSSGGRALLALLCLMAPLAAGGLYWHLGSPELATFSATHPHTDWRDQATSISYFVGRVRERLAKQPDDADAWALLARTEMQLGHYNEALAAAESLNRVLPEHAGAMLLLVDALLMAGGDEHRSRALALTGKVLHNEPGNPSALVMKGLFEQQEGDTATALATWQQALSLAGQDGGLKSQIEELIARAGGTVQKAAPRVAVKRRGHARRPRSLRARKRAMPCSSPRARWMGRPCRSRYRATLSPNCPCPSPWMTAWRWCPAIRWPTSSSSTSWRAYPRAAPPTPAAATWKAKSATLDIKDAAEIAIDIDRALP